MSVKLMSAIFETEFRDLVDAEGNVTKASTAKLVLLALADHANDEGEGAYPGLTKMEKKTALSRQGIINTYDALKYNGIIYLEGESKLGTNNYTIRTESFPIMSGSQPTLLVNPLDQPGQPTLPEVVNPLDLNHTLTINKPSLRGKEKLKGIEVAIFADRPVTEEDMEGKVIQEACNEFESALGFGALPWDSTNAWTIFRKWVVKVSRPGLWEEYAKWRRNGGKYDAMSNKQIRQNPLMFIDTGYPAFEAHKTMYAEKESGHYL